MVGGDAAFPQPLCQMMCDPFGQPPGVYEDQGGAILFDYRRQPVIDISPHLVGRNRSQFVPGYFDRQLHFAAVSDVDDGNWTRRAGQEIRDGSDGFLSGRKGFSVSSSRCSRERLRYAPRLSRGKA